MLILKKGTYIWAYGKHGNPAPELEPEPEPEPDK